MQIDPSNLEVHHNTERKRFEIQINGHQAVVEYMLAGNRIIFSHTEVDAALEGQGIAALLAKTALKHAQAHHLEVMPLCPYIATYLRRHPEYQVLLAPGFNV